MIDVVTLGEAMIRLSPPDFKRLEQADHFHAFVGGGELNVAVALSRLGLGSRWVSKLPENPLGKMIRNKAREQGVDTDYILWEDKGRAGIYFMEYGASPRPSVVLYDRAGSSASQMKKGEFQWEKIFRGARWFHVSGITAALSKSCAELTLEALKMARGCGLITSYDLNYRSKLWSEDTAQKTQEPLMEYVDVLISTEEDTQRVFKIKGGGTKVDKENYRIVAKKLMDRFHFKIVCITLRENMTVWKNNWNALVYDGKRYYTDKQYRIEIVDRIGGGDSFSAGFIYGYLSTDGDIQYAVKFGNALAALAHSIPGDFNLSTKEDVERLLKGEGLRIKR
ncbi:MAG: sugar kinase [Spirochaetes bacterium]|nr:sugar kinase [Spirochaetota bacterium]